MKLAMVGVGSMGEALLAGWLASGVVTPDEVGVVQRTAERAAQLGERYGVPAISLPEAAAAETLVLAVKPHQMGGVLEQVAGSLGPDTLVVSVAAGVTLADLEGALPGAAVIRVMPNTPSLVGHGMAGIIAGTSADAAQTGRVVDLMRAVGGAMITDEAHLDALTALSGSGPAYLYYVAEAMIEAGVHQGLPRAQATELVNQTFIGAAAMLDQAGESATVLRERVTSPGGTTAAALRALDDHGVRSGFLAAVEACARRSAEMSRRD